MDLGQLTDEQDGVVRREQALRHLSPAALRHRLRPGGPWQTVHPAVYLTTTGAPTRRQQMRAALLYAGPHAQLAGATALEVGGLDALRGAAARDPLVHLLVPHSQRLAARRTVVVHRTHRLPAPLLVAGLPASPVARAVVDACRDLRSAADVRAAVAEAVQRRRTTVDRLAAEVQAGHSSGSALVRAALEEVADGVRSAPEGTLRRLLGRSRLLPPALWNCRLLLHGRWLADPDAYFEDAGLVVEYESRRWHLRPEDWEATLARHDRLEACGLHVLHLSPGRLRGDREAVLRTVEQAYAASLRAGPPPGVTVLRPAA